MQPTLQDVKVERIVEDLLAYENKTTNHRTSCPLLRGACSQWNTALFEAEHSKVPVFLSLRSFLLLLREIPRQVARHCNRLFPLDLAAAGRLDPAVVAAQLREKFTILGRNNERKRLASQLELKMRAIFYDLIDPAAVEEYIASIYEEVRRWGCGGGWRRLNVKWMKALSRSIFLSFGASRSSFTPRSGWGFPPLPVCDSQVELW